MINMVNYNVIRGTQQVMGNIYVNSSFTVNKTVNYIIGYANSGGAYNLASASMTLSPGSNIIPFLFNQASIGITALGTYNITITVSEPITNVTLLGITIADPTFTVISPTGVISFVNLVMNVS